MKAQWVIVLAGAALLAGAFLGFRICMRFWVEPIEARAERELALAEERIEKVSNQKAEEFIREIESAPDTSVLDDYLSPELRDRLRELLEP